jgi:hypothetical protein
MGSLRTDLEKASQTIGTLEEAMDIIVEHASQAAAVDNSVFHTEMLNGLLKLVLQNEIHKGGSRDDVMDNEEKKRILGGVDGSLRQILEIPDEESTEEPVLKESQGTLKRLAQSIMTTLSSTTDPHNEQDIKNGQVGWDIDESEEV